MSLGHVTGIKLDGKSVRKGLVLNIELGIICAQVTLESPRVCKLTQGVCVKSTEHLVKADSVKPIRVTTGRDPYKRNKRGRAKGNVKGWKYRSQENFSKGK